LVTLRCTKKLLNNLGPAATLKPAVAPQPSTAATTETTTALGDWYATLVYARPKHLVLCVSERSRLAVVLHAAPLSTLVPRFVPALDEVLQALGVSEAAIGREEREMAPIHLGPTQSRSILGTMNEYVKMLEYKEYDEADAGSPLQISLSLSRILWSPLGWRYPEEVTRELLEAPQAKPKADKAE